MRAILLSVSIFLIPSLIQAQTQSTKLLFTNAMVIDQDRYKGIDESPYMFAEWRAGTIYDNKGRHLPKVEINFNGHSNEIEIRKNGKYIELEQFHYSKIVVFHDGKETVFERNVQDHFSNEFVVIIHKGSSISAVRKFQAKLEEKEFQNLGKTEKIKRFLPKYTYWFIKDGKLSEVKAKKKQLISFLGHKKALDAFINSAKLKNDRLAHIKEILEYVETL